MWQWQVVKAVRRNIYGFRCKICAWLLNVQQQHRVTISWYSMGCFNTLSMVHFQRFVAMSSHTRSDLLSKLHTTLASYRFIMWQLSLQQQQRQRRWNIIRLGEWMRKKTPNYRRVTEAFLKKTPTNTLLEIYGFLNKWKNIVPQIRIDIKVAEINDFGRALDCVIDARNL